MAEGKYNLQKQRTRDPLINILLNDFQPYINPEIYVWINQATFKLNQAIALNRNTKNLARED